MYRRHALKIAASAISLCLPAVALAQEKSSVLTIDKFLEELRTSGSVVGRTVLVDRHLVLNVDEFTHRAISVLECTFWLTDESYIYIPRTNGGHGKTVTFNDNTLLPCAIVKCDDRSAPSGPIRIENGRYILPGYTEQHRDSLHNRV